MGDDGAEKKKSVVVEKKSTRDDGLILSRVEILSYAGNSSPRSVRLLSLHLPRGRKLTGLRHLELFHNLEELDVSFNHLSSLEGLSCLPRLQVLNASHNRILTWHPHDLPSSLQVLNLRGNLLTRIPKLTAPIRKEASDESGGNNSALRVNLPKLRVLLLSENRLDRLSDLERLRTLKHLESFSMMGNPITQTLGHAEEYAVYLLRSLEILDGEAVGLERRQKARERFEEEETGKLRALLAQERRENKDRADAQEKAEQEARRLSKVVHELKGENERLAEQLRMMSSTHKELEREKHAVDILLDNNVKVNVQTNQELVQLKQALQTFSDKTKKSDDVDVLHKLARIKELAKAFNQSPSPQHRAQLMASLYECLDDPALPDKHVPVLQDLLDGLESTNHPSKSSQSFQSTQSSTLKAKQHALQEHLAFHRMERAHIEALQNETDKLRSTLEEAENQIRALEAKLMDAEQDREQLQELKKRYTDKVESLSLREKQLVSDLQKREQENDLLNSDINHLKGKWKDWESNLSALLLELSGAFTDHQHLSSPESLQSFVERIHSALLPLTDDKSLILTMLKYVEEFVHVVSQLSTTQTDLEKQKELVEQVTSRNRELNNTAILVSSKVQTLEKTAAQKEAALLEAELKLKQVNGQLREAEEQFLATQQALLALQEKANGTKSALVDRNGEISKVEGRLRELNEAISKASEQRKRESELLLELTQRRANSEKQLMQKQLELQEYTAQALQAKGELERWKDEHSKTVPSKKDIETAKKRLEEIETDISLASKRLELLSGTLAEKDTAGSIKLLESFLARDAEKRMAAHRSSARREIEKAQGLFETCMRRLQLAHYQKEKALHQEIAALESDLEDLRRTFGNHIDALRDLVSGRGSDKVFHIADLIKETSASILDQRKEMRKAQKLWSVVAEKEARIQFLASKVDFIAADRKLHDERWRARYEEDMGKLARLIKEHWVEEGRKGVGKQAHEHLQVKTLPRTPIQTSPSQSPSRSPTAMLQAKVQELKQVLENKN